MNERRWAYVPAGRIGGPPKAPPPPELVAQYAKQRGTDLPPATTLTEDMERQAGPMTVQHEQMTTPLDDSPSQNVTFQHLPARRTLSQKCTKRDEEPQINSRQRDANFVREQPCAPVKRLFKPETLVRARRSKPHTLHSGQLFDCQNNPSGLGRGDQSATGAVHNESEAVGCNDTVSFRSDASDGTAMDSLESGETLIVSSLDDVDAPQGNRQSASHQVSKLRNAQGNEANIGSIKTEKAMIPPSVGIVQTSARTEQFGDTRTGDYTMESERIGVVKHERRLSMSARPSRVEDEGQQDAESAPEGDRAVRHVLSQLCTGENADNNTQSHASNSNHIHQQGSIKGNIPRGFRNDEDICQASFRTIDRNQHNRLEEGTAPKGRGPLGRYAAAPHAKQSYCGPECDGGLVNTHLRTNLGKTPLENDLDKSKHSQSQRSLDESQDGQHISLSDIVELEQSGFSESSQSLDLSESGCPRHADLIGEDSNNHISRDLGSRRTGNVVADTALEANDFRPTSLTYRAAGRPTVLVAAFDNAEASQDIGDNSTYASHTFNQNEHQQPGEHARAPGYQIHCKNRILQTQPLSSESPTISARDPTSCNTLNGKRTEPRAWLGPIRHGRYNVAIHKNAPDAISTSEFSSSGARTSEKKCDDRPVVDEELVVSSNAAACHNEPPKKCEAKVEYRPYCSKLTLPQAAAIALSRTTLRTNPPTKETQTEEHDDNRSEDSGESISSHRLLESASSNASQDTFRTERLEVDDLGAKTRAMIQSYAHLRRAVRDSKEARDVYMATCLDKDAAFRRIFFDLIDHGAAPMGMHSAEVPSYDGKSSRVDGAVLLQHPEHSVATPTDRKVGSPKDDQRTRQKGKPIRSSLHVVQSPSCQRLHRLREVLIEELQRRKGSMSSGKKLEAALSELGRAISSITTRGNGELYDTQQRLLDKSLGSDMYTAHISKERMQRMANSALQQRHNNKLVAIQGEDAIRKQPKIDSPARTIECVKLDACAKVSTWRDEFSELHTSALNEARGALSILSTDGVWRRRHFRLDIIRRTLQSGRIRIDLARISRVNAPHDVRTFDLVCFDPPGFYKLRAPCVSDRATWLHRLEPALDMSDERSLF